MKTELQTIQSRLDKSTGSVAQIRKENVMLTEKQQTVSENQQIMSEKLSSVQRESSEGFDKVSGLIEDALAQFTTAQSISGQENDPIYFEYGLKNHLTETSSWEIVKFDVPRAVSQQNPYDPSSGKVTIAVEGVYYFYVQVLPHESSKDMQLDINIGNVPACRTYKESGRASMSCAIIRHFSIGQEIYVKHKNKVYYGTDGNQFTGFLGFKLY